MCPNRLHGVCFGFDINQRVVFTYNVFTAADIIKLMSCRAEEVHVNHKFLHLVSLTCADVCLVKYVILRTIKTLKAY